MKLIHVTLNVSDMAASIWFYRDILELPLVRRFQSDDAEIAFLGDGEVEIELIYRPGQTYIAPSSDITLGFAVPSVIETISAMRSKGFETSTIFQPNDHVRFFFMQDDEGPRIQFVENIE